MLKIPVYIKVGYVSIKNPNVEYFPLTGAYDAVPENISVFVRR